MKKLSSLLMLAALLLPFAAAAGTIQIRVSFKAVRDPNTGAKPASIDDALLDGVVAGMNALLTSYGRGYRIQRTGPLIEVGARGGFNSGPSRWYFTDFHDPNSGDAWKDQMQADAKNNTVQYAWDNSAINIYITEYAGKVAGMCSFPTDDIIVVSWRFLDRPEGPERQLHEIGHYFSLYHTQGRSCGGCDSCGGASDDKSDHVSDTLVDWACWDQDDIAQNNNLGASYAALSAANRGRVDDVFFNIMSYHNNQPLTRLTPGQLDRWTDSANDSRGTVRTGRTRFVDYHNNAFTPNGSSERQILPLPNGTGGPFPTVGQGVNFAGAGDIVLVRAGTYQEGLTLTRPLTLRASRGDAILR